ncbi:Phosphatidylinositolglycan class N-domain-containing protein [Syncephalis pseudoplumigaleata]|uniref:GPI ethanolamine phosphate transferase 1 n=1 Tax=Syncephalis pseudoplumigaleata TaxID=1712513 RepID=A0A4P9YU98_9FUNG|nr:Phosphatidylinositolglycan class N-domain-containing protein [Syncephalis pseudoplumigaleata]|eukprot:RKP22430.1 Phosphatidylinositolglycan class N-domain-containing protein [Syncephalis pseudoplumigaleata]
MMMIVESKRQTEIAFRPFEPLAHQQATRKLASIEQLIEQAKYDEAKREAIDLIHQCLQGLRYYQTYDWRFLRSIVSVGYLGWIAYSLLFIVNTYVFEGGSRHLTSNIAPATKPEASSSVATRRFVYSYFDRRVLSACLWLLACWPWTLAASFRSHHRMLIGMWQLSCVVTSIFPLLPVEKGDDIMLVMAGGMATLVVGAVYLVKLAPRLHADASYNHSYYITLWQMLLIIVSMITTASSVRRLELRQGLSWWNQVAGWMTLGLSLVTPLLTSRQAQHYLHRLATIFLAFSPTFILLSISYPFRGWG